MKRSIFPTSKKLDANLKNKKFLPKTSKSIWSTLWTKPRIPQPLQLDSQTTTTTERKKKEQPYFKRSGKKPIHFNLKKAQNERSFYKLLRPKTYLYILKKPQSAKLVKQRWFKNWSKDKQETYDRKMRAGTWRGSSWIKIPSWINWIGRAFKPYLYQKLRRKRMRRYSKLKPKVKLYRKHFWKYRIMWDRGADRVKKWRWVCDIMFSWRLRVKPKIRLYNFKGKIRNTIVNHRKEGLLRMVRYFNFAWSNIIRKSFREAGFRNIKKPIWKFKRYCSRTENFLNTKPINREIWTMTSYAKEFWKPSKLFYTSYGKCNNHKKY